MGEVVNLAEARLRSPTYVRRLWREIIESQDRIINDRADQPFDRARDLPPCDVEA